MDARIRPLPMLLRGDDGPHGLCPALSLGPETALHGSLFWVDRVDSLLCYRGESEALSPATPDRTGPHRATPRV